MKNKNEKNSVRLSIFVCTMDACILVDIFLCTVDTCIPVYVIDTCIPVYVINHIYSSVYTD